MRVRVSVNKRQWVLPLGFAVSMHHKSVYIFCIGIDFTSGFLAEQMRLVEEERKRGGYIRKGW